MEQEHALICYVMSAWVRTCCPLYESSVDGLVNHSPVVPNPESHPLRRHSVSLRASLPLQFSYTNITLRCCNLNWKLCTFLALCKLNLVSYLLSRCWPRGTLLRTKPRQNLTWQDQQDHWTAETKGTRIDNRKSTSSDRSRDQKTYQWYAEHTLDMTRTYHYHDITYRRYEITYRWYVGNRYIRTLIHVLSLVIRDQFQL